MSGEDETPVCLQSPLDPNLIGVWMAEVCGTSLKDLRPVAPHSRHEITLRADGTADHRHRFPELRIELPSDCPLAVTWETTEAGTLTILIPIAPMPQYEMPDWTYEAMRFDVLAVTPATLTLSNRPHDGESITVYRRMR